MRVVVIDSENQTVYESQIGKDFREIYPLIGNGCTTFCCPLALPNGDMMFADDEALLRDEIKGAFIMDDWSSPIYGNVVLINSDEEGESVDALSDVEQIKSQITWVSVGDAYTHAIQTLSRPPAIIFLNDDDQTGII
jgi:hypothetical protein